MFVDHVELELSSGKGGPGCVAFRREKFVTKGGPNGGDGGKGGDVWFRVDNNTHTLAHFHGVHKIHAENGKPGLGSNMTGKSAPKLFIIVPPGTQVFDAETDELILDLVREGDEKKLLTGGKGGLGNPHFKSSTNQRPMYAQPGETGVGRKVRLELKLIADVGLVGFPNVGKSTLISTVSNAAPEIANYEFTTLTPKLGQVHVSDYESFVMADIPGIIGGASEGKGLGLQFLRHIERTKTLLIMVDLASYMTMTYQYETLREELKKFSETLAGRAYAVALTRADALSTEDAVAKVTEMMQLLGLEPSSHTRFDFETSLPFFEQELADERHAFDVSKPYVMVPISSVTHRNVKPLTYALHAMTGGTLV